MSKLNKKFRTNLNKSTDSVNPDSYDRMKERQDEIYHVSGYPLEHLESFMYVLGKLEVPSLESASEWLIDEITDCFREKGMDNHETIDHILAIVDCEPDFYRGREL